MFEIVSSFGQNVEIVIHVAQNLLGFRNFYSPGLRHFREKQREREKTVVHEFLFRQSEHDVISWNEEQTFQVVDL